VSSCGSRLGTTSRAPVELRRYPWTWRTRLRIKRAEVWVRDKGGTSALELLAPCGENELPTLRHTLVRNGMKLGWECTALAVECQQVIVLRLLKLSRGGTAASKEANRMVSEKLGALVQTGMRAATGGSLHSSIRRYRKTVRSNRRRLVR
jgi:hypothetical protein